MRLAGLVAIYQRPNTSKPAPTHKVYPYLLGGISIERVNQVWCSDATYIPMAKGFLYLVVIMDWVLTFRRFTSRTLSAGRRRAPGSSRLACRGSAMLLAGLPSLARPKSIFSTP